MGRLRGAGWLRGVGKLSASVEHQRTTRLELEEVELRLELEEVALRLELEEVELGTPFVRSLLMRVDGSTARDDEHDGSASDRVNRHFARRDHCDTAP